MRHYFAISVLLIAGGLVTSGLLEIYFRYHESREHLSLLQREAATVAAVKIERFIRDVETAMKAASKGQDIAQGDLSSNYNFELKRLLFLAPAITEAVALDPEGVKQAEISRFRGVSPGLPSDMSTSSAFQQARLGNSYFGPVYFVRQSEPHMTIALPIEQFKRNVIGVLQAEVNLKYVWEVVSDIRSGKMGYAYAVSRSGDLIAHPDLSLVLQQRNVAQLEPVKEAFQPSLAGSKPKAMVTYNLQGKKVISSYALLPSLDWAVFIERPVEEAYEPLYASIFRTSSLLLLGFGVALLATLLVSRRVVRPLETLRHGVERIRKGDLTARLDLQTGDEIEILAEEFNEMAAHLREAYTDLERRVAERTRALTIANAKLEEVSQHKSRFLANVNHELRTPVSAIIGYARLVLRATEGQIASLQKENLQDLLNNAERLLNLIDGLLDFARIEAGKMELRVEPVGVDEIIHVAASTVEPILNGGSIRLTREIAPGLPALNTDREKLRQIILNLLDNAAKFTERGEIKISASQQNGSLRLVVSDTGIGIEKKDLDQIFEEFHRGDFQNTKQYRGTGLGLAIAKRFVTLLGGEITVDSEVGKGSTFTIMLPLNDRENRT
ncbi:MAG TPA: sensor histidine kinase [Candidatus Binatia bacterium]|nr:sensor histidine kinase [Candidatus Binatia bacterium]